MVINNIQSVSNCVNEAQSRAQQNDAPITGTELDNCDLLTDQVIMNHNSNLTAQHTHTHFIVGIVQLEWNWTHVLWPNRRNLFDFVRFDIVFHLFKWQNCCLLLEIGRFDFDFMILWIPSTYLVNDVWQVIKPFHCELNYICLEMIKSHHTRAEHHIKTLWSI